MPIDATPGGTVFTPAVNGAAALASQVNQFAAPINNLETGVGKWCVATGSANAYVIAPSPPVFATSGNVLAAGPEILFQANFGNTGAATVSVNGIVTAPLVRPDGTPLQSGDIAANQIVHARFDGTSFRLEGWPQSPAFAQNQTATYANDSGTANTYAVALTPALTAYAAGQVVSFKVGNTNTGAVTLNVNALGAKAVVKYGSTALVAGDLVAGEIVTVMYDGTNFQLMSPAIVPVAEGGTGATTLTGIVKGTGATPMVAAVHNVDYESPADVQNQAAIFATDTGTANNYVITLSPVLSSLQVGTIVSFKAANANTSTTFLKVNGIGSTAIQITTMTPSGSSGMSGGEIQAGQIVTCVFDGTYWQLVSLPNEIQVQHGGTGATTASGARTNLQAAQSGANSDITSLSGLTTPLSVAQGGSGAATLTGLVKGNGTSAFTAAVANTDYESPGNVQQQAAVYAADTGSANAYAVTLSPAPTIVAGSLVVFKVGVGNANTGASTLAVNGGTATAIKRNGGTALAGGELIAGQIVTVIYDGTNWQMVTWPGWLPQPVAQGGTGVATLTPYALLCGGTTSTGASQQVSGLGTAGQVLTSGGPGALPTWQSATAMYQENGYRLTLTSGTPITTSDVTAATTLYWTPFTSDIIWTYDSNVWTAHNPGQLTITNAGLSASTFYYVYVYNNAGTLTLYLSTTAPTQQNGVMVGGGGASAPTTAYRYLGCIATDALSKFNDSKSLRTVANWQNAVKRLVFNQNAGAVTGTSTTYAQLSSVQATNIVAVVQWVAWHLDCTYVSNSGVGNNVAWGVGSSATALLNANCFGFLSEPTASYGFPGAGVASPEAQSAGTIYTRYGIGSSSGSAGTCTWDNPALWAEILS